MSPKSFKNKSWKTTGAGLLAVLVVAVHLGFAAYGHTLTEQMVMAELPALVGGLGLLFARDNDKSSEDVGTK